MRKVANPLFKQWAIGIADHGVGGCEKFLEHDRTSRGMNTSPTVEEGTYVLFNVPEAAHSWVSHGLRHITAKST
jgi:hypothetical protein